MNTNAATADGAGAGATMDEGDDEYVDPNLYSLRKYCPLLDG